MKELKNSVMHQVKAKQKRKIIITEQKCLFSYYSLKTIIIAFSMITRVFYLYSYITRRKLFE